MWGDRVSGGTQALVRGSQCVLFSCVGGGVRIHPENARMSGRHGVQYVAQCVACAALTPVVWQKTTNLSILVCDVSRSHAGGDILADLGLYGAGCVRERPMDPRHHGHLGRFRCGSRLHPGSHPGMHSIQMIMDQSTGFRS